MKLTKTQRRIRRLRYWLKENEPLLWVVGYAVFWYVAVAR